LADGSAVRVHGTNRCTILGRYRLRKQSEGDDESYNLFHFFFLYFFFSTKL
jgi:hypothetical protein